VSAALRFVHLLSLAVWIGAVVFFSFVTAPALFGALPREMAGRATAAIFPRYYVLGATCGGAALVSGALLALRSPGAVRWLLPEVLIVAVMTGLTLYAGWGILPEADRLRRALHAPPGGIENGAMRARFSDLHRRSVALNGAVLLLGLSALALTALDHRAGPGP